MLHRHRFLLFLLATALCLRLIYLLEIEYSPAGLMYLDDQTDMNFFHEEAVLIADGDWLLDRPLHPYHLWHEQVAKEVLQPGPESEQRQIWDNWYGGKSYHQEPLYPYFIAALYSLAGKGPVIVYLVQFLMGLGSIFLLYLISRDLFNETTGRIAAVIASLYAPMLYYEVILLRATMIVFISLLLVWLTMRALCSGGFLSWGYLGLVVGIAILIKSTFILYPAGLVLLLIFANRGWRKKEDQEGMPLLRKGVIMGACALLPLLPFVARNMAVGASPLRMSSVTPVTFLVSNLSTAEPYRFYPLQEDVGRIMEETEGKFLPVVIETLKTHSPESFAGLLLRKLALIYHWYEFPNNANYNYFLLHSGVLRFLPISSMLLMPLILIGMFLAIARVRGLAPLLLMMGTHLAAVLLVYTASRFRLPIIVVGIPLAAFAVNQFIAACKGRRFQKPAFLLLAWVAGAVLTIRPLPAESALINPRNYYSSLELYYGPELQVAHSFGDWARVGAVWESFLATEPRFVRELGDTHPPRNRAEQDCAHIFSNAYDAYSRVLIELGQREDAERAHARAQELRKMADMPL